jgi:D-serine dehydratase
MYISGVGQQTELLRMQIDDIEFDDLMKGIPGGTAPFRANAAAARAWNVLRQDMTFPLALLRDSALNHNSAWMQKFLEVTGAKIAPHGKTTMSPQLFRRQLQDGAWGITLATIQQVQVARKFGIQRIFLANQLVGRQAIRFVLDEMERDPNFDFYCIADSVEGVEILARAMRERQPARPIQILIEGGIARARTGCRDLETAMSVARCVKSHEPHLSLRGIEGFEGIVSDPNPELAAEKAEEFLQFLALIAKRCAEEDLYGPGPVLLTAGGSRFYDIVARVFGAVDLRRETEVVIRSGCYLTHDSIMYDAFAREMRERSDEARDIGAPLQPAVEVWAEIQSRPEPGLAFAILGKRDASYDAGLPCPQKWFRPGLHTRPEEISAGHRSSNIHDQHLFLEIPKNSPLGVGDLVCFGISHPCLTFDKWSALPIVDDDYNVVSMIRTYF